MNNTTSHHTIDMIFAQTWLMVCQLHQGTAITHGESFYRRVCQLIDEHAKNSLSMAIQNPPLNTCNMPNVR